MTKKLDETKNETNILISVYIFLVYEFDPNKSDLSEITF